MSYLDVPRLHFFGRFQAAPSTLNNDPGNYNPANPLDPAWNPNGTHWFKLDCTVRSTVLAQPATNPDPLVGTPLASVDGHPQIGKLVDLDPDQQAVSMIFGMQVRIGTGDDWVQGTFRPVNFVDMYARVIGGQADSVFSAAYQSVLENLQWGPAITSPVLKTLQTTSPDALSIRFIVDAFQDVSQDPTTYMPNQDFTWGRVTGTVGPWSKGEPTNFTLGRLLRPNGRSGLGRISNYAPFRVDRERAVVIADLGNVLPALWVAGAFPPQMGPLTLVCGAGTETQVTLGTVDYSDAAYQDHAMVQEFPIPAEHLEMVDSSPLQLVQSGGANLMLVPGRTSTVLAEDPTGAYVDSTQYVFRMAAGSTAQAEVIALTFGKPAAGQTITFTDCSADQFGPGTGTPATGLTYDTSVTTDANGRATFTLNAHDPQNPRTYIDGQVYAVAWSWDQDKNPDVNSAFLSVLVFDAFTPPDPSTWNDPATWQNVVKPIFDQYMRLYPFMQERVDLSDYPTVVGLREQIAGYLALPIEHPSHMPVTRDLSPPKSAFLVSWLKAINPAGVPESMAGTMYGHIPIPGPMPGTSGSSGASAAPSAHPSGSAAPSGAPAAPANPGPSAAGSDAPAH
ncbi:hypothetical protein [Longimicrobium sp.]|uniref:Ig-like domain-containing protein n=1 Tax=Longimicrobium sp. TaxID=2029185 RepID=UPI002E33A8D2|nr:hypothetical protein [Longimicrobium sp.]HEX6041650.1 hypothetical protein [Longimicrobium sp.]